MPIAAAEEKKTLGNQAFKSGNYRQAVEHYSQAIAIDPRTQTYWSNRSASYAGMGDWQNAANDAAECIKVDKGFIKGYFRLALAQKNLGQYEAAVDTIKKGLTVDVLNQDLKSMAKECEEQLRLQKVSAIVETANKQAAERDYASCIKTIEAGLRIDAGNSQLNALLKKVKPQWEREEKSRKAGLSPVERIKEEGDELYKGARFEDAIKTYTKALDRIPDKASDLALKCFANRSACYKQLSNFDHVIADTTSVLEAKPNDVKCLLRRAQAFEAVERYKMALQDVRQLLSLPREEVGDANVSIANGLQHRLNRVIQKLKEES